MFSGQNNFALFMHEMKKRQAQRQIELSLALKVISGVMIILLSNDDKQKKELQDISKIDNLVDFQTNIENLKESEIESLFYKLSSKLDQMVPINNVTPNGDFEDIASLSNPKKLVKSLKKTSEKLATTILSTTQRWELEQLNDIIDIPLLNEKACETAFNEFLKSIDKYPNIKPAFINIILNNFQSTYLIACRLHEEALQENQSLEANEEKEMVRSFSP